MNIRPIKCEKCGKNLTLFEGNICLECEEKAIQEPMRDATQKELASVNDYIKSISKPTGIKFYDAEPCEDAISREAAIKKLIEQSTQVYIDETDYQRGYIDGVNQMVKELKVERQKSIECSDAVSRQAVNDAINDVIVKYIPILYGSFKKIPLELARAIIQLPPVIPQPKTGHWIGDNQAFYIYAKCSECGSVHDAKSQYCPTCGCLMEYEEETE